jgi:hypothetical protein
VDLSESVDNLLKFIKEEGAKKVPYCLFSTAFFGKVDLPMNPKPRDRNIHRRWSSGQHFAFADDWLNPKERESRVQGYPLIGFPSLEMVI